MPKEYNKQYGFVEDVSWFVTGARWSSRSKPFGESLPGQSAFPAGIH